MTATLFLGGLVTLTCSHCHRSLHPSESNEPPLFCMYCGHKLRAGDGRTSGDVETQAFVPTAPELDDDTSLVPDQLPLTVGGYRLLRQIGRGGMGAVYEAEPPAGGPRVAVKLLSPRLAASPTSVERFRQEGRLASQLAHPRCVFVLAADTDAGRPYIVMELMPGRTLKDEVEARGPLPPDEAIRHILDVIDGLGEAHRVGMIHRDIKPSNCFVTADGRVKVGDFGLSKSLTDSRDRHLTQSGAFLGTVLFASPEQIRGEPLDYGSDVYSVCATLYYLLSGEAPYHHESLTAALARAISEPPAPLRAKRPEISRGLSLVVMKGLERDRDRRWQTLDELRDALVALLPNRRHPARPRALIGAYLIDRIAILLLAIPALILQAWANGASDIDLENFEQRWLPLSIMIAYFTVCEGVFGSTAGKWLLGLRLSRLGQTVPPGVLRAWVRTNVFHGLLFGVVGLPQLALVWLGPASGGLLGGTLFALSLVGLLVQFRKKWGNRGIHDLVTGCHVTQRPLPKRKLRLTIPQPTPLAVFLPPPEDALPATLGGYIVRGRIAVDPAGNQVWMGEDSALARRVLLWLRPAGTNEIAPGEASRPSRLRRLGGGTATWSGVAYDWTALAAPLGGPLAAAIDPARPLPWADARHLVEQLVDELRAAESDGTMPAVLGLDQVWVEPNGRVQLLDCSPVNGPPSKSRTPLALVREVASLALEGRPRSHAGTVRAPIPPHAAHILQRLFTDNGYPSLADLQRELAETQHHRPEVTPAMRGAQIGIQVSMVGTALAVMFVLAFSMGLVLTIGDLQGEHEATEALDAVTDPRKLAALAEYHELDKPLKSPHVVHRLQELRDRLQADARFRRTTLFAPQRLILEQYETHALQEEVEHEHREIVEVHYTPQVREAIQWAGAAEHTPRWNAPSPWGQPQRLFFAVLLAIPLGLALLAAVLRGGVSFILAGLTLVRMDGRRATRGQCGLRAALVWFPVAALLFGSTAVQAFAPERAFLAAGLWLFALALLPIEIVIALKYPTRGPQDLVAGTSLIPS